jgi:tRNA A-37 threonylcarbamoyl transferase component Bud32
MLPPARERPASERRATETIEWSVGGASSAGERAREPDVPRGGVIAGRYEVLDVLGRGGFAVVYRAFDRELRRQVALKILRADRLTREALGRLRREAALARDAVSANLVRVFDVGSSGDAVFLTMEIVDGGSLERRLTEGPLPVVETVRIATQALAGLAALHALRIVHRDVKPGNVLLAASGEVKLADFGLARQLGGCESRLTQDNALLGTLQYLSPEQALGEEIDSRSDLFSLGVVLFEMLTGRLPHEGRSALGALLGHLREKPPEVRAWRPEVPRWLAAVVARLLARLPAERYPSAEAALADLAARRAWTVRGRLGCQARPAFVRALLFVVVFGAPTATWRIWNALPKMPEQAHRFSHLVERPGGVTEAIGRAGETLWTVPGSPPAAFALAHLRRGAPPVLIGILQSSGTPKATHTLSVLDPEDKRVLREVPLPDGADRFPNFGPTFDGPTLEAVDLDGDGGDEILVTYRHKTMWPGYLVLYEPRIGRTRLVFFSSGHHHLARAVDLDGDGRPELLIAGINNRMGWYTGIAAVRLIPAVNQPGDERLSAGSPDDVYSGTSSRPLLWYALGPPERFLDQIRSCGVDRATRRIDCAYDGNVHLTLGFDGFPPDSPSALAGAERQTARDRSYRELREAMRLLAGDDPADALPAVERAVEEAERAGDRRLHDWTERVHATILVSAGHLAEGEALFEKIAATSEAVSGVCYDAGKALHFAGSLSRAVAWYRRGLGRGGTVNVGRNKWEYLEGEVLALTELRRFAEARAEIDRYAATYFDDDRDYVEAYRRYVLWREGSAPLAGEPALGHAEPDFLGYVRLESLFAAGADPQELLATIQADLPRSTETVPELLSLESVVLRRLGRTAEARRAAEEGYRLALHQRTRYIGVRALFDLLARRAGRPAPRLRS